jgi:hypothetical protein
MEDTLAASDRTLDNKFHQMTICAYLRLAKKLSERHSFNIVVPEEWKKFAEQEGSEFI